MASRRCPSCGERYNGKRCKNCLYEPFGEVRTSYDLHQEEILVPREIPQPDRSRPARKQKRSSSAGKVLLKRLGTFWVVFMLLTGAVPALVEIVGDLAAESFMEATPEPIPLPADGIVIYEDADIQVIADWDGESPIDGDISIFVENFSNEDRIVCTDGVSINGCMIDDVFFYCDAYRNSVSMATLWLDMEVLQELGFKEVRYLQMAIDVMDEDYNLLMDDAIYDTGGVYVHELDEDGLLLYEEEGFRLIYQGWRSSDGDSILHFYGENTTDSTLELSGNELLIDGKETGYWIWQKLLPGAKRVFYVYLQDFVIPDGDVSAEVELFLTPDGDWSREILLGSISFPLN